MTRMNCRAASIAGAGLAFLWAVGGPPPPSPPPPSEAPDGKQLEWCAVLSRLPDLLATGHSKRRGGEAAKRQEGKEASRRLYKGRRSVARHREPCLTYVCGSGGHRR